MGKKTAAVLVIFCLLGGPLSADEIRLSNGDQLTGTIVELEENIVKMDTRSGEMHIPRDQVVSVFLGKKYVSLPREASDMSKTPKTTLKSAQGQEEAMGKPHENKAVPRF